MKIQDLAIEKLKKFIEIKELSQIGTKKDFCETILNYIEQQVIQEIQTCWNSYSQSQTEQKLTDEADASPVGLEKGVQSFIRSHEAEKTKILNSLNVLKIKKQKLKKRIEEQKQNVSNLPNIIRFTAGQEVSISKSSIEKYPNSLLYTLISTQYWSDKLEENKCCLNCSETEMINLLDLVRTEHQHIEIPALFNKWGFEPNQYSNTECLKLDSVVIEDDPENDYEKFKQSIENEIKSQYDLLDFNFQNFERQLDALKDLIYDDPINLNVGGKMFTISKTKLEQYENTYFSPLVSGNWTLDNNTHFIDRSSKHFHIIYYHLLYCELVSVEQYFNSLNKTDQKIFLSELDYYQLHELIDYLIISFCQSKLLNQEEIKYVDSLYPGKWRLIPKEEITDTIESTTVILTKRRNDPSLGPISKLTENFTDLTYKDWITFNCLGIGQRTQTTRKRFSEYGIKARLITSDKYEIYEKIM